MCDGIFLNYNWNEQILASSKALASDRSCDVYVGIDVFGRGCYGGGGFNSCKVHVDDNYVMYELHITEVVPISLQPFKHTCFPVQTAPKEQDVVLGCWTKTSIPDGK